MHFKFHLYEDFLLLFLLLLLLRLLIRHGKCFIFYACSLDVQFSHQHFEDRPNLELVFHFLRFLSNQLSSSLFTSFLLLPAHFYEPILNLAELRMYKVSEKSFRDHLEARVSALRTLLNKRAPVPPLSRLAGIVV